MTRNAFTLLEVLLSISLIAVLSAISIPIYRSLQTRNSLDLAVNSIVQGLKRAQTLSQAIEGDSGWGVRVEIDKATLFKGVSFAGRDSAFDEVFEFSGNINPSGVQEIAFAKFSGQPQATGTLTLTIPNSGETRIITINEKGTINY